MGHRLRRLFRQHHRHCRLPVSRLRVTGKNPYNFIMVLSVCYSVCPIGESKQYEMKMFTPLRRSYAFVVVCLFVRYSDSFVPSVSRITHERVYGRRPNLLGVGGGMAEWLLVSVTGLRSSGRGFESRCGKK